MAKLDNWKGSSLSMAGHLSLINSIIYGSFIHSFLVYKWPSLLLKSLERCLKNFLWTGSTISKKLVSVHWDICCSPLDEGGLNLKCLHLLNSSMLSKLAWKLMSHEGYFFSFLRSRFLYKSKVVRSSHINSSIWSSIKGCYAELLRQSQWVVYKHSSLNFWNDKWLDYVIADKIGIPLKIRNSLCASIFDLFQNNVWHLSRNFRSSFPDICSEIESLVFTHIPSDALIYYNSPNGSLSCKLFYMNCHRLSTKVIWGKELWRHYLPPARSFLAWRLLHGRIPTDDHLCARGFHLVSRCYLCVNQHESLDHTFSSCSYAVAVWTALASLFEVSLNFSSGFSALFHMAWSLKFSSQLRVLWRAGVLEAIHSIWYARNRAVFHDNFIPIYIAIRKMCKAIQEASLFKVGYVQCYI